MSVWNSTPNRRLFLTLKVALRALFVTGERHLGFPVPENLDNLLVRNVAHLVVFLDDFAILVADASAILWDGHQRITRLVCCTDIAVNACPSLFTLAGIGISDRSVRSIRQSATDWRKTVVPPEALRALAFAVELVALGELATSEGG